MAVRKPSKAAESAASRGSGEFDRLRRQAAAEARCGAALVDLPFQAPDHHIPDPAAHGVSHFAGAGEAHRIEHLEEAGERAGVAVVGCGREEQPVLELRRDQPQRAAELAVLAERSGHQVVALVHDQQVPRQVRRALGNAGGGEELLAHVGLAQVVVGGDDAVEGTPRVRVHTEAAAEAVGRLPVHDLEAQRELVAEFVAPLVAKRRRGEDEDAPYAPSEQQLGEDQSRLDGLAQTDVVGDQQAHARHRERLEQRDELVVLDTDTTVERAGYRLGAERAVAVWIEPRGERGPAGGAEQRVEVFGRHRVARRIGQRVRFVERAVRFQLPEEAFFGR